MTENGGHANASGSRNRLCIGGVHVDVFLMRHALVSSVLLLGACTRRQPPAASDKGTDNGTAVASSNPSLDTRGPALPSATASTKPNPGAANANITPALGIPIPGKVVPAALSVAWDGSLGSLVNCSERTATSTHEGDLISTTCNTVRLASGASLLESGWRSVLPKNNEFVEDTKKIVGDAIPNQYGTAVRGFAGPMMLSEFDSGSAARGCMDAVASLEGRALGPLSRCTVVRPAVASDASSALTAVVLRGVNNNLFASAYRAAQESGGPDPWTTTVRDHIYSWGNTNKESGKDGQKAREKGTLTVRAGGQGAPFVAVGVDTLAIVSRELLSKDVSTIDLYLHAQTFDNGSRAMKLTLARGIVGTPTISTHPRGFVIAWASKLKGARGYSIQGAEVSEAGVVTDLGTLPVNDVDKDSGNSSFLAPAISARGNALAITFTEEREGKPSVVRFACGRVDWKSLAKAAAPIGDLAKKSRDSELSLSNDGESGVIAWQEFTKETQGIRVAQFKCNESN
jgi:hypothetical protein